MYGVVFKKLSLLAKRYTVNGQKNFSRALKWGIVHLCISYTFINIVKNAKIFIFEFS